MREILFRGKRIDNGKWVYGFYTESCAVRMGTVIENDDDDYCVDPETVGQYTGLKDKNGKKIFEGDIVKYIPDDENEVGVDYYYIEYKDAQFRIGRDGIGQNYADEWEVVGNIHDNPELLEG